MTTTSPLALVEAALLAARPAVPAVAAVLLATALAGKLERQLAAPQAKAAAATPPPVKRALMLAVPPPWEARVARAATSARAARLVKASVVQVAQVALLPNP